MAEHLNPIAFRASKALRDRLEKAALHEGHSLNQEIIRRLEMTFIYEDAGDYMEALFKGIQPSPRGR